MRLIAVISVVSVLIVDEPLRFFVVVFVYHRHFKRISILPSFREVFTIGKRSNGTDNGNLRMLCPDGVVDHFEALFELWCNLVFVTDANVFKIEWLGMSRCSSQRSPP